MEYCCFNNQRTGTCYFEYQKGKFEDNFWLDSSIYLHADLFDKLNLYQIFVKAVPEFAYYGITEIDREKWNLLIVTANQIGGSIKCVFHEIDSWVNLFSPTENVITILGI